MANSKFENLILYVCRKGADDSRLGKVKLNKLLFLSDFGYYRKSGVSISGEDYMRLREGPAPRQMLPVLTSLQQSGKTRVEMVPTGLRPMERTIAVADPNLSDFSAAEISFVDSIVERYWKLTGTDLSKLTHFDFGYCAAADRETIPYATAYMPSTVEMDVAEDGVVGRTQELAARFGWDAKYATA
ncbi:MAG: Panacea domain-containing protein [Gammaproteobacteria bacterium]